MNFMTDGPSVFAWGQAFYQPRAVPKLNWPIFQKLLCPYDSAFVRVAHKRAEAMKMAVYSYEKRTIVRYSSSRGQGYFGACRRP
jgi:hypothetical protein